MTAKHTPGPWVADSFPYYGHPARLTPTISINPVILGQVVKLPIAKVHRISDEHAANARLIAAAPDLLEALKDARRELAYAGRQEAHDRAHAAITKAVGGAA